MGNKSSVRALRLSISQPFDADWFAEKGEFAKTLHEDVKLREYLQKNFAQAVISRIFISRVKDAVTINVQCVKPAYIIGKKGVEIEAVTKKLKSIAEGKDVQLKIFDIKKPELTAACVAKDVAIELAKKGAACRRVIKKFVNNSRKNGAIGIRIECSGRLGGAEIARTEWYQEGAVPRQKFRANIDYSEQSSYSSCGLSGVKVWIYKGDIVGKHAWREDK